MNSTRTITLVGAGSIGGFVASTLAYMSRTYDTRLIVLDHDTVEAHNRTNQIYRREDIGVPKVTACAEILQQLAEEMETLPSAKEVTQSDRFYHPVILAVDSTRARRAIFSAIRDSFVCPFLVDARSGIEYGTVFVLNPMDPDHAEAYLATLPTEEDASPVPCANPDAIPLLFAIASIVAQHVNDYFTKGVVHFKETALNYSVIGPSVDTVVINTLLL